MLDVATDSGSNLESAILIKYNALNGFATNMP